MESDIVYVKCPLCGKPFNSHDQFYWSADFDGHPTVENIQCPHCYVGTENHNNCDSCPMQFAGKCDKEETCGCDIKFGYEEFKTCDKDGNLI